MSAKRYAKRFLYGLGKAFYLFGKGLYILSKAFAKAIRISYRNYQERQRREEMIRQHYRGIEREAYVAERGRQRAISDFRGQERARREEQRYWRETPERIERFIYGDDSPRKRKKKRQVFGF